MRILVSNDDGVHAEGIKVLADSLSHLGEVIIVAPLEERSSTGHGLSLHSAIRLIEIEENVYGCSGYPADCTLFGLSHILKGKPVDVVVSGINKGGNLGQDVYYSGTAAAAREAVFRGVPGIAVSTMTDRLLDGSEPEHYQTAGHFVAKLIENKVYEKLPAKWMLNINVPDKNSQEVKGVKVANLGFRHYTDQIIERLDNRGKPYYWIGGGYNGFEKAPNTDCLAIDEGFISLSPLNLLALNSDIPREWLENEGFFSSFISS